MFACSAGSTLTGCDLYGPPLQSSLRGFVSHPEQLGFLSLVEKENRRVVNGGRVLEIGSYDVNGSMRELYSHCREYIGVDLCEGPGVDSVGFGHELDLPDSSFDVAISGECFEHDPYWTKTVLNMCRMTRPGGLVAFTCASAGRPEHGTRRTDRHESPGTQAQGLDYYRNLTEQDFSRELDLQEFFSSWSFWYLHTHCDLYFAGVRGGLGTEVAVSARLPRDEDVKALRGIMSLPHRVARIPLRVAQRFVDGDRYQDVIRPYWRTLLRIQDVALGGRFRRASH